MRRCVTARKDQAPYGWRHDPHHSDRFIEDPDEQDTIAWIVHWRSYDLSYRDITRRLNDGPFRCRGIRWHHSTEKRILDRALRKGLPAA